ncbi:MAG: hypothetical protein HRU19_26785 [Pseudobacteriovorax sp.]|nr:hypothetical protein [Pseudobacteriovorax sp.]
MTNTRSSVRIQTHQYNWRLTFLINAKRVTMKVSDLSEGGLRVHGDSDVGDDVYVGQIISEISCDVSGELFGPFEGQISRATYYGNEDLISFVMIPTNKSGLLLLRRMYQTLFPDINLNPSSPDSAPQIPYLHDSSPSGSQKRLNFLRRQTQKSLQYLAMGATENTLSSQSVDYRIGGMEKPLGVAGPLTINGEHVASSLYAPMGLSCPGSSDFLQQVFRLINTIGGVTTSVVKKERCTQITYELDSIESAIALEKWADKHLKRLASEVFNFNGMETIDYKGSIDHHVFQIELTIGLKTQVEEFKIHGATRKLSSLVAGEYLRVHGGSIEVMSLALVNQVAKDGYNLTPLTRIQVFGRIEIPKLILSQELGISAEKILTNHQQVSRTNARHYSYFDWIIRGISQVTGQSIDSSLCKDIQTSLTETDETLILTALMQSMPLDTSSDSLLYSQRSCLDLLDCNDTFKEPRLAEILVGFGVAALLTEILGNATTSPKGYHLAPESPLNLSDVSLIKSKIQEFYAQTVDVLPLNSTFEPEDLHRSHSYRIQVSTAESSEPDYFLISSLSDDGVCYRNFLATCDSFNPKLRKLIYDPSVIVAYEGFKRQWLPFVELPQDLASTLLPPHAKIQLTDVAIICQDLKGSENHKVVDQIEMLAQLKASLPMNTFSFAMRTEAQVINQHLMLWLHMLQTSEKAWSTFYPKPLLGAQKRYLATMDRWLKRFFEQTMSVSITDTSGMRFTKHGCQIQSWDQLSYLPAPIDFIDLIVHNPSSCRDHHIPQLIQLYQDSYHEALGKSGGQPFDWEDWQACMYYYSAIIFPMRSLYRYEMYQTSGGHYHDNLYALLTYLEK